MNRQAAFFEAAALLCFLAVVVLVFFQTNTHFVEEGAASGSAMDNAALFPELAAGAILALAALQAVRLATSAIRGLPGSAGEALADSNAPAGQTPEERSAERPLAKAIACFAAFVAYLLAVDWIGYHIATPVWMAVQFGVLGVRNPMVLVSISLAASLAVAYVFEGMLNIVLPVGIFEIALPV